MFYSVFILTFLSKRMGLIEKHPQLRKNKHEQLLSVSNEVKKEVLRKAMLAFQSFLKKAQMRGGCESSALVNRKL